MTNGKTKAPIPPPVDTIPIATDCSFGKYLPTSDMTKGHIAEYPSSTIKKLVRDRMKLFETTAEKIDTVHGSVKNKMSRSPFNPR